MKNVLSIYCTTSISFTNGNHILYPLQMLDFVLIVSIAQCGSRYSSSGMFASSVIVKPHLSSSNTQSPYCNAGRRGRLPVAARLFLHRTLRTDAEQRAPSGLRPALPTRTPCKHASIWLRPRNLRTSRILPRHQA